MKGLLLKYLYNVKGFARQYVIVILAMAVWGICMKNISFVSIYIYGDSRWDDEHYNHEHG